MIETHQSTNSKAGATHIAMPPILSKAAFTLAEVLITLGIIGVVAAMTIPTLMTKMQWLVLKQQYKEVYSTLNQALQLVYENTDTIFECYYLENGNDSSKGGAYSECVDLYEQLKQVLKISHICETNAYANGCIPKYKGIDTVYADNNSDKNFEDTPENEGCAYFKEDKILNYNTAWVLHDGTIIGFFGKEPNALTKIFFVDINGTKGPNKWGWDVFPLLIVSDKSGNKLYLDPRGSCYGIEKGGRGGWNMLHR